MSVSQWVPSLTFLAENTTLHERAMEPELTPQGHPSRLGFWGSVAECCGTPGTALALLCPKRRDGSVLEQGPRSQDSVPNSAIDLLWDTERVTSLVVPQFPILGWSYFHTAQK